MNEFIFFAKYFFNDSNNSIFNNSNKYEIWKDKWRSIILFYLAWIMKISIIWFSWLSRIKTWNFSSTFSYIKDSKYRYIHSKLILSFIQSLLKYKKYHFSIRLIEIIQSFKNFSFLNIIKDEINILSI